MTQSSPMPVSDTQRMVLSAAAQRADGNVLPLPGSLRGPNARRVVAALLRRGLIAETVTRSWTKASAKHNTFWRNDEDGRATLLHITPAGLAAVGSAGGAKAAAPQGSGAAHEESQCPHCNGAGRRLHLAGTELAHTTRCHICDPEPEPPASQEAVATPAPPPRRQRDGTKQAALIAMLQAPEGASVAEIAAALGWQRHTVRAALSHGLKRRLGLGVASHRDETRGRVYRLQAEG